MALGPSHSGMPGDAAAQAEGILREFYFSRVEYTGYGRGFYGRRGSWATDYPKADQIFLSFIDRLLANLDAYEQEHRVRLDDPELGRFPYLYALEVGYMALTEPEISGLRSYLLAGGFLVIDDFWGSYQWANFEYHMQLVLPGYPIVDLTLEHPIFTTFYEIEEIMQVPNVGNGINGGQTHERDGIVPMVKGIYDENGRPHGVHQLQHRPGRRLGVGGPPLLSAQVFDVCLRDGRELDRVRHESLMRTEEAT